ncbi:hypothetical protein AB0D08_22100 [Kitasatospora sp. NPDC048540]|uniref:hypothetical protein n=1 Tax=Kitasatospora sp. NPDC048540 TaxID=3155634 RepID=UPI0033CAE2CD
MDEHAQLGVHQPLDLGVRLLFEAQVGLRIRRGGSGSGSADAAAYAGVVMAAEPTVAATVMAAMPARTDLREMKSGTASPSVRP